jgi:hypothetical protein
MSEIISCARGPPIQDQNFGRHHTHELGLEAWTFILLPPFGP